MFIFTKITSGVSGMPAIHLHGRDRFSQEAASSGTAFTCCLSGRRIALHAKAPKPAGRITANRQCGRKRAGMLSPHGSATAPASSQHAGKGHTSVRKSPCRQTPSRFTSLLHVKTGSGSLPSAARAQTPKNPEIHGKKPRQSFSQKQNPFGYTLIIIKASCIVKRKRQTPQK